VPYFSISLAHYGDSYTCKGLLHSFASTNNDGIQKDKKVSVDSTTKDLDTLSIRIDGDQLHFLTQASVAAGSTGDERPLKIIENSNDHMVAVDIYPAFPDQNIDTFNLNKKTGMAVWNRTLTTLLGVSDPAGETEYFSCY